MSDIKDCEHKYATPMCILCSPADLIKRINVLQRHLALALAVVDAARELLQMRSDHLPTFMPKWIKMQRAISALDAEFPGEGKDAKV